MAPSPFIFTRDDATFGRVYIGTLRSLEESIAKPPCECSDCHDAFHKVADQRGDPGNHAYRDRFSDSEAERRASSTVRQIHGCREALRARLCTSADVLMSRWKKLSQAKRETLLMEVEPGLEKEQWLLARYCYMSDERLDVHKRSRRRRRQLLLPWLNVDVLKANPSALLALMHCRTAFSPQCWAAFDNRQLTLSWHTRSFDVDFSRKCVVMFGDSYGSLVDWEETTAHRADTLGFPRAMLVLEAQAYLMQLLSNIATKILSGVDSSKPPQISKWQNLVENNAFSGTGVVEYWSAYTNPAFSPPAVFDTKHLLSLARARREATGDHVWYLQCHATYMRRHLKILLDMDVYKKASKSHRSLMIVDHIRFEVRNHHLWQWLETECRHVDEVRDKLHGNIQPGTALPTHYERALGALEVLLVNHYVYRLKRLETLLRLAPGFQQYWTFKAHAGASHPDRIGSLSSKIGNSNTEEMLANDPLYWCLAQLPAVPGEGPYFDPSMLFAMLEERLAKSPSDKKRVDEVMYQLLSDLAVGHEMLTTVRSHRPRHKARREEEIVRTENRQGWRRVEYGQFGNKITVGKSNTFSVVDGTAKQKPYDREYRGVTHNNAVVEKIGDSLFKNFYEVRPPTGPKTSAWLAQHRELRSSLEKFWDSIRKTIRKDFDASDLRETEISDLMKIVSAGLSKVYADEKRQEDDAIIAAIQESEKPQILQKFTESASPNERTAPRPDKTKRRRQRASTVDGNDLALDDAAAAAEQADPCHMVEAAPIRVMKHSLDVFQLMFPEKGEAATKFVLWDRFVHAMADAGFVARNTSGSLVSFKNAETEGRIVFHRPHPDPKIDPIMLQAMGKRMTKWFGWKRGLFLVGGESSPC